MVRQLDDITETCPNMMTRKHQDSSSQVKPKHLTLVSGGSRHSHLKGGGHEMRLNAKGTVGRELYRGRKLIYNVITTRKIR